jgi:hypothetical protein
MKGRNLSSQLLALSRQLKAESRKLQQLTQRLLFFAPSFVSSSIVAG